MLIDVHVHAYLFPSPPQDGHTQFCTPEQVLKRYDEVGIDCGILLPLIGPEVYMPQSNQEILEICNRYPGRFIPFCNIDPRGITNTVKTDFSPWLDWYKANGFKGVGEFMPNMSFLDPMVQNFMRQLEKYDMPLTFDVAAKLGARYGLVDQPGLPELEICLQRYPKLVILGHGPEFWSEISTLDKVEDKYTYPRYPVRAEGAVVRLLRNYPNMWGDLSAGSGFNALHRDEEFAIKFLNEFQDKLCFGTDLCYVTEELPLADFLRSLVARGKLSKEAFDKIAYQNITRLIHLN